ncbi:similar to Saccharomyces cerevisiae YJR056C Putative protein of unknown function [Maudiozyma barnettii]|uniref:YJR056C-like protein n=1 Tax=Maudiozyma barnettii TaxID=61262 RepID=A0A8H2VFN5_9SACH|nr:hypothetical protein [Kazachstania barnettii]CAB4254652.1 similar to Saccharomyces cerevisiae YJR056C Putative protein of unknown function [Kazachstania barnettii]CAD1782694.1 similar to Saccharomyces cerevisiae YJR056C Putative protein of unknown function [Kazachstania barnettii]
MEKLHSLETSLPPEQPPTKQAIDSLNNELSQEFKVAANAVTRLYRVANEKNSLVKHQGYIECLDDILNCVENSTFNSLEDLRLWCSRQKSDRIGTKGTSKVESKNEINPYNFKFEEKKNINSPKFRLSMPPLSVEHSQPSENHGRYKTRLKNHVDINKNDTNISNPTQMDSNILDYDNVNSNIKSQQLSRFNLSHMISPPDSQARTLKKIKLDNNNKI